MARHRYDLSEPTLIDLDRRQRRVPSPLPPPPNAASQDDVVLIATRLATVEQQLTAYFSSIATQANATRVAAENARHEARTDLEALAGTLYDAIERLTSQSADDRRALRHALDARLADIGAHQDWRFAELEARLESVVHEARTTPGVVGHVDPAQFDQVVAPLAARLVALGDQVTEASERIRLLDAGNAALQQQIGALEAAHGQIDTTMLERFRSLDGVMAQRVAAIDQALTGRLVGIEEGLGNRFSELDQQMSALRGGIDQALAAVSARMTEIESAHAGTVERVTAVEAVTAAIDLTEIQHLREKVQAAVGENVIIRIEMDRLSAGLDERFDAVRVRISEVEGRISDNNDVNAALQLERLEELERAVMMLTPLDEPVAHLTAQAAALEASVTAPVVPPPPSVSPIMGDPTRPATTVPVMTAATAPPAVPSLPVATAVPAPPTVVAPTVVPPPPARSTAPVPPPPPPVSTVPPPPPPPAVPPTPSLTAFA